MAHFAALLPMKDEKLSAELRAQHLSYLDDLQQQGKIFAKGRFTDGAGGLVVYIAESLAAAQEMAEQDPFVSQGARGLELHEWDLI